MADGIDEEILAAGFRPVPFRHIFEPLAKYLPGFLRSPPSPECPVPEPLKPQQRSRPLSVRTDEENAGQDADEPAPFEPTVQLAGTTHGKNALKSPARLLEATRLLPQSDHVPGRIFWPRRATLFVSVGCLVLGILVDRALLSTVTPQRSSQSAATMTTDAMQTADTVRLKAAEEESLDAAYTAQWAGNFAQAEQLFRALKPAHPGWHFIDAAVGTAELYQRDLAAAQPTFEVLTNAEPNRADACFRLGVLYTIRRAYDRAEECFATAVATDPSRPEYYYFWGECLHQEGKDRTAASRFRSALLRNEFEAASSFYRLKFWLCEVEADLEDHDGISAQIDAAVAVPNPPVEALVAVAARHLKAGDFKTAAQRLLQARDLVSPALYFVLLQDPVFRQERWRPEMAQVFATSS